MLGKLPCFCIITNFPSLCGPISNPKPTLEDSSRILAHRHRTMEQQRGKVQAKLVITKQTNKNHGNYGVNCSFVKGLLEKCWQKDLCRWMYWKVANQRILGDVPIPRSWGWFGNLRYLVEDYHGRGSKGPTQNPKGHGSESRRSYFSQLICICLIPVHVCVL